VDRHRSEENQPAYQDPSEQHFKIGIRAVAAAICNQGRVEQKKPSMKIGIRAVAAAICNQAQVDYAKPARKEISVTPAATQDQHSDT
jgi:hypothetical protein